jgi:hypothetical protein
VLNIEWGGNSTENYKNTLNYYIFLMKLLRKTETIKCRAIWVYTKTIEQKRQWIKIAKQEGMSLSKWIVQNIENSLVRNEDEVKSGREIGGENKNLKKEIKNLKDKDIVSLQTDLRNNECNISKGEKNSNEEKYEELIRFLDRLDINKKN